MAKLGRITGQLLTANLERDGVNLSVETDLLYLDVANSRIGINTDLPTASLQVDNITVDGSAIRSVTGKLDLGPLSNISTSGGSAGNVIVTDGSGNVSFQSTNTFLGDLTFSGTTMSTGLTDTSITVQPTGTGSFIIDATSAVLIPVGTSAQRPITPAIGHYRFNTSLDSAELYNGSTWIRVGDPDTSVVFVDNFVGDDSTTDFIMSGMATTNQIIVDINGVIQHPVASYLAAGSTVTFTEAPAAGDNISIRRFTSSANNEIIANSAETTYIVIEEVALDETIYMYADSAKKATVSSDGVGVLVQASDPTIVANTAHLYSKDDVGNAAMYVQDEAGNATKISSHTPDGEWEYFSVNKTTGKRVRINMEKMIRKLEEITGETFFDEDIPKS